MRCEDLLGFLGPELAAARPDGLGWGKKNIDLVMGFC